MAGEKNYYKEALEALNNRRERERERCEMRREEVYAASPEAREADIELSRTASKLFFAARQGGDEEIERITEETRRLRRLYREKLEAAGFPADYTDMKYRCEKCHDSGFVGVDMCTCLKADIARARLADSDMGPLADVQRFDNFSLDYYNGDNRRAAEYNLHALENFAARFTKNSGESWLLIGATGLGKTHLSTALGVEVIRRGYDVVYKSVQSMLDDFEAEQFHGASPDVIRKYYDCDLLIVDDLGVEMSTQFNISCIYNVINTRMNARRSTVFSTNLSQKELRDKYADRITSRLFGSYKPLVFSGVDVRRQKLSQ